MNLKSILILVAIIAVFGQKVQAQELNVSVNINTPNLQTTDPKVFETLQGTLSDFLNSQKWSEDGFEPEERIDVNIQLTISKENSPTSFGAELAIQSTRPIYGSNYSTPMLNHVDKSVSFEYEQFQPLEFSITTFIDNLSTLMSFYVYVILGLDYDSFSLYGGEQYFQQAQSIMNNIPSTVLGSYKGWAALDGNRNRYWMIENLLSPGLRSYRKAMYDYHRQGLDVAESDLITARAVILQALQDLDGANKKYPNSMILQMFINSKADEIVEIFKEATSSEKSTVKQVLGKLDPSRASKYRREIGN
ncbi:MAG: DUF4835 family protein [Saprospiraceae bacterium]|nr:DUF4835 family protein [Saprospiraceae bacterium]